jgi:hypothetical protein
VSTEPRTVTVTTVDHGPVTFTCPPWCVADHEDGGYRADIAHTGPDVALVFHGLNVGVAALVQAPYAETSSRKPGVSVSLLGQTLDPTGLYDFAAALDTHADKLRDLADQAAALLAGGAE